LIVTGWGEKNRENKNNSSIPGTYVFKDLNEAVRIMAKVQLNQNSSDQQVADIVAFLGALTGAYPKIVMPRLPATPGTTLLTK